MRFRVSAFVPLACCLWIWMASGTPCAAVAPIASQWDFNGNSSATVGGVSVNVTYVAPALKAGIAYTNVVIAGQPAQAALLTRGSLLRANHRLDPNGGGLLVNQYSIILDVMFPDKPAGLIALLHPSTTSSDDAEWFLNSEGEIGLKGAFGGKIGWGEWHRLAWVVDAARPGLWIYVDGALAQQTTQGIALDGRYALPTTAILFLDNNKENGTVVINSLQIRGEAMSPEEVNALGPATAAGIPIPAPTSLALTFPKGGETFTAGQTSDVTWSVEHPIGSAKIELWKSGKLKSALGTTSIRSNSFVWRVDRYLGDGADYRIRVTSLADTNLFSVCASDFTIQGSVALNTNYGVALQLNGGFEEALNHWTTVAGNPITLLATQGKGSPHSGKLFLHGGKATTAEESVVSQVVDLAAAGFSPADMDDLSVAQVDGWLRNKYEAGTFDDQVFMRLRYLDAQDAELSSLRSLLPVTGAWSHQFMGGLLPGGTRRLSLEVVGKHRVDPDNDSMADDLILKLTRPTTTPRAVTISKLPMLQDYRQNAMTMIWETDGNVASHRIAWGRVDTSENSETRIATLQIDDTHFVHQGTLTGLSPETRYVYRVISGESSTPPYSFSTAPKAESPFAVAWWGDNHDGTTTLRTHVSNILSHAPNMICVAGDMVNSGSSASEWNDYWFKPLEHMNAAQTTPVLFARGNHDGEHALAYAYSVLPGNGAWYSFSYGNSWFLFLDTEADSSAVPEQFAWLKKELQRPEARAAAFRIVCFHRPPWTDFWNGGGYTGETWVRDLWTPLLAQSDVDIVVSGHTHAYCRGATNGVTYVVSGGGGGVVDTERVATWPMFQSEYTDTHFDLMEVDGARLDWRAFSVNNQLIDQFRLHSRAAELDLASVDPKSGSGALVMTGRSGLRYALERSSNMIHWDAFATNAVSTAGSPITNTIPLAASRDFLRARTLP
ncbi:MAG: metallophosphoesterase [Verrucomicrobia bacterium]|nr:metallophosphoesterase [Verrucomicrobiota bacterium]MBI3867649.1 metallophosphoesterase [Verrucomicrobiota bacterium]